MENITVSNNPYRIPSGKMRIINFSGGRSSGYMLYKILEAHGGTLPLNAKVIFTNTGKERPETLRFITNCSIHFAVPIMWLEWCYYPNAKGGVRDPKYGYRRVNWISASKRGEPFRKMIETQGMVPNVVMRRCTQELKIRTVQRYCFRELGLRKSDYVNVLGIRADEPHRVGRTLYKHCAVEYPLVVSNVVESDVMSFWAGRPFDLGITSDQGNCDLCFLKGRKLLTQLVGKNPDSVTWWMQQERTLKKKDGSYGTFNKRYTYTDIRDDAAGGVRVNVNADSKQLSCFCGD